MNHMTLNLLTLYFLIYSCSEESQDIFISFDSFKDDDMREKYLHTELQTELRYTLEMMFKSEERISYAEINVEKCLFETCQTFYNECITHIENITSITNLKCPPQFRITYIYEKLKQLLDEEIHEYLRDFRVSKRNIYNYIFESSYIIIEMFYQYVFDEVTRQLKKDIVNFRKIITLLYYRKYIKNQLTYDTVQKGTMEKIFNCVNWNKMKFFSIDCARLINDGFIQETLEDIINYIESQPTTKFNIYFFNSLNDQLEFFLEERLNMQVIGKKTEENISKLFFEKINNRNADALKFLELLKKGTKVDKNDKKSVEECFDNLKVEMQENLQQMTNDFVKEWRSFLSESKRKYEIEIYLIHGNRNFMIYNGMRGPHNRDYEKMWYKVIQQRRTEFLDIMNKCLEELCAKLKY